MRGAEEMPRALAVNRAPGVWERPPLPAFFWELQLLSPRSDS